MTTIEKIRELSARLRAYETEVAALQRFTCLSAVSLYYNGHNSTPASDEMLELIRVALVAEQRRRVLHLLTRMHEDDGVVITAEIERVESIVGATS